MVAEGTVLPARPTQTTTAEAGRPKAKWNDRTSFRRKHIMLRIQKLQPMTVSDKATLTLTMLLFHLLLFLLFALAEQSG